MRRIIAYKGYYSEFMAKLPKEDQQKVRRSLTLFETEDKLPTHYIKFLRDGIYEFRVSCAGGEVRILFIYDGENMVILFNCFKKKSRKTPENEIKKAIKLKNEYYGKQG